MRALSLSLSSKIILEMNLRARNRFHCRGSRGWGQVSFSQVRDHFFAYLFAATGVVLWPKNRILLLLLPFFLSLLQMLPDGPNGTHWCTFTRRHIQIRTQTDNFSCDTVASASFWLHKVATVVDFFVPQFLAAKSKKSRRWRRRSKDEDEAKEGCGSTASPVAGATGEWTWIL